jgi:hypothetical protein
VIGLEVGPRRKAQAKQAAGAVEGRLDHLLEDEIGLHLGLAEIVSGAADAFGPVAPVPGARSARSDRPRAPPARGRRAPRRRAACVRALIDWVKALFAEQRDMLAGAA